MIYYFCGASCGKTKEYPNIMKILIHVSILCFLYNNNNNKKKKLRNTRNKRTVLLWICTELIESVEFFFSYLDSSEASYHCKIKL